MHDTRSYSGPSTGLGSYTVTVNSKTVPVTVTAVSSPSDGSADAYNINVGGKNVLVEYPHGTNPVATSNNTATFGTLARLFATEPGDVLNQLTRQPVAVTNQQSSSWLDTSAARIKLYQTSGNNTTDTGAFNSLVGVVAHETGHAVQYQNFTPQQTSDWQQAEQNDGHSITGYGNYMSVEDFAETWRLYNTVVGTPAEENYRRQYPERFAFIDNLVPSLRAQSTATNVQPISYKGL